MKRSSEVSKRSFTCLAGKTVQIEVLFSCCTLLRVSFHIPRRLGIQVSSANLFLGNQVIKNRLRLETELHSQISLDYFIKISRFIYRCTLPTLSLRLPVISDSSTAKIFFSKEYYFLLLKNKSLLQTGEISPIIQTNETRLTFFYWHVIQCQQTLIRQQIKLALFALCKQTRRKQRNNIFRRFKNYLAYLS